MNHLLLNRIPAAAAEVLAGLATAANVQATVLALAAARSAPGSAAVGEPRLRWAIVVPAHDEEAGIAATVTSLRELREDARIVVVADNCTDATAARAAAAGAETLERSDPNRRGKGFALAWAFDRILREPGGPDAVLVIDADCRASENLLDAVEARLNAGSDAVQASYVVSNPDESAASALRYAGFAMVNTVRPLGRSALGGSAGLLGTGMAFRRDLLERQPWRAFSFAEDREQHLELVASGERVAFAPEAWVSSPMPTSLRASEQQQARWESGKLRLVRHLSPVLVRRWLRTGDWAALDAALEPLLPSQSLLLAMSALSGGLALLLSRPGLLARSVANVVVQLGCIAWALRLVGAPAAVYRAIVLAPAFLVQRLGLLSRLAAGRRPRTWVRTERPG